MDNVFFYFLFYLNFFVEVRKESSNNALSSISPPPTGRYTGFLFAPPLLFVSSAFNQTGISWTLCSPPNPGTSYCQARTQQLKGSDELKGPFSPLLLLSPPPPLLLTPFPTPTAILTWLLAAGHSDGHTCPPGLNIQIFFCLFYRLLIGPFSLFLPSSILPSPPPLPPLPPQFWLAGDKKAERMRLSCEEAAR